MQNVMHDCLSRLETFPNKVNKDKFETENLSKEKLKISFRLYRKKLLLKRGFDNDPQCQNALKNLSLRDSLTRFSMAKLF